MNYYDNYKHQQSQRLELNLTHDQYFDIYQGLDRRLSTFRKMFRYLDNIPSPVIVETGISRMINNYSGDGHSTLLFDEYLHFFKKSGKLISIDIDRDKCEFTKPLLTEKSTVICSDSVTALHSFSEDPNFPKIDLLYLDSYDVDWNYTHPSAFHHIKELLAIYHKLKPGTLVVVDDNDNGKGKGQYIANYMSNINKYPYFDAYQIGWVL